MTVAEFILCIGLGLSGLYLAIELTRILRERERILKRMDNRLKKAENNRE